MALKSNLFRGDPKLEAAAVSPSAHVMRGAVGEHVLKIQYAIARVEGIPLEQDGMFGPATAAAVLAYKRKRNIVNRAYQSQADDIVGIMTLASLDGDILQLEKSGGAVQAIRCSIVGQGNRGNMPVL